MVTVAILCSFFTPLTRWKGAVAGLNRHKAGVKAETYANPLGRRMRGETLAAVVLCGCLAASRPAFAEPTYAQATKYNLDISGADLLTAQIGRAHV